MLCQCCETAVGTIDCKDCVPTPSQQQTPSQWLVLCEQCCTFIHRGALKDHQLIFPEMKKKRDDVKDKLSSFKENRQWELKAHDDLASIKKEIEEHQMMFENGIKNKITEIQQELKRVGINMLNTVRELSAAKTKVLDDFMKDMDTNVKSAGEVEVKLDTLINDISEFEKEISNYDDKLDYKFVDLSSPPFPKLSIPFKIDYSAVEKAVSELQLVPVDGSVKNVQSGMPEEKSEPCDVSLQSRIDSQGVFWIHVDFKEEMLSQLLGISYDIRTMYMMSKDWKTYDKLPEGPQVGDLVYGLWNVDNKWYRGRIEDVNGQHATVVFLDFGNSEKLDFSCILPVQDHIVSDLPFQALECSLFPEPREIPLNLKFEFTDMIAGGPLHCKVLGKKAFGEKEVTYIELVKDMPDGSLLNLAKYLESRCQQVKQKCDMPFASRDVRLLENPDAFSGSKSSEQSSHDRSASSAGETSDVADSSYVSEETVPAEPKSPQGNLASGDDTQDESVPTHSGVVVNGDASSAEVVAVQNHDNGTDDHAPSSADVIIESEYTEDHFLLPKASLDIGNYLQIVIDKDFHSLNRDGSFWAMIHRNEEENKEWARFKKALDNDGEKAPPCTKINDGSMVLAQWKKHWHRAKVDSLPEDASAPKYKIRLIDYGTSCKVSDNQIRVLPLTYYSIVPSQAVKLSIATDKLSQFGKDAQSYFLRLVEGKTMTAEILRISGAKETCLEVHLTDCSGDAPVNIVDLMVERETNRKLRMGQGEVDTDAEVQAVNAPAPVDGWHQDVVPDRSAVQNPVQNYPPDQYVEFVQYPQGHGGEGYHPPGEYPHTETGDYNRHQRHGDRHGQRSGGGWRDRDRHGGDRDGRHGGEGQRACYQCGDPSHFSKNCPNNQRDQRSGGGGRPRRNRRT